MFLVYMTPLPQKPFSSQKAGHPSPWSVYRIVFSLCSQTGDLILCFCFLSCVVELEILGQLQQLRLENRQTQSFRYTKSSAANVTSAIRQYLYFTNYFGLQQLPASVDTLVCFMEFMARTSGYGHLKHLYSSVKFLHEALNHSFPENNFQQMYLFKYFLSTHKS